jgi:hypothetical protein
VRVADEVGRDELLLVYSRIPFIGPSAAVLNAAFTCRTVTGLSTTTARSVTRHVGRRNADGDAVDLPLELGMTSDVAFAAPVVVGMIDSAPRGRGAVLVRQIEHVLVVRCSCGS